MSEKDATTKTIDEKTYLHHSTHGPPAVNDNEICEKSELSNGIVTIVYSLQTFLTCNTDTDVCLLNQTQRAQTQRDSLGDGWC